MSKWKQYVVFTLSEIRYGVPIVDGSEIVQLPEPLSEAKKQRILVLGDGDLSIGILVNDVNQVQLLSDHYIMNPPFLTNRPRGRTLPWEAEAQEISASTEKIMIGSVNGEINNRSVHTNENDDQQLPSVRNELSRCFCRLTRLAILDIRQAA